jgi:hypothetical protein
MLFISYFAIKITSEIVTAVVGIVISKSFLALVPFEMTIVTTLDTIYFILAQFVIFSFIYQFVIVIVKLLILILKSRILTYGSTSSAVDTLLNFTSVLQIALQGSSQTIKEVSQVVSL